MLKFSLKHNTDKVPGTILFFHVYSVLSAISVIFNRSFNVIFMFDNFVCLFCYSGPLNIHQFIYYLTKRDLPLIRY